MEDFEKVKGSKTKVDVGLIDFELIPTSEDVTHGDASQQDEDCEGDNELSILDNWRVS